jgi:hypothetical protein
MNDFPFLVGAARDRAEDSNHATGLFSWAVRELNKTINAAERHPKNYKLLVAARDTAEAITEQLVRWEASNGPH